jgi:hypothetical protein
MTMRSWYALAVWAICSLWVAPAVIDYAFSLPSTWGKAVGGELLFLLWCSSIPTVIAFVATRNIPND